MKQRLLNCLRERVYAALNVSCRVFELDMKRELFMVRRIRKYLSTVTVLALLTTNVLVLVHDATNALLSAAVVGITKPFAALIGESPLVQ